MIRSNSAPRSSGSMAKRPPVKRELAVTPGGREGCKEPLVALLGPWCGGGTGRVGVAVGRALRGLTDASLVSFVVLPEGHQSDGDGLQERPDGRCELWGEASKSGSRGGQGSGGQRKGG